MQVKNTAAHFGVISIFLHWLIALLILGQITLGLIMTRIPVSAQKLMFYGWHKEFGALIGMLVLVRIGWRIYNVNPSLGSLPAWERFAARSVHYVLYVLMVIVPLTGWLMSSAAGLPVSFFGLFTLPDLIQANEAQRQLFVTIHSYLAYTLLAVIGLHTAAALKHHFIDRDDILKRMLKP